MKNKNTTLKSDFELLGITYLPYESRPYSKKLIKELYSSYINTILIED
jgi:hypothetical protein